MALIFVSLSTSKMWHPAVKRSTSIGHRTIHQGTWEEFCSPVCQVTGRQYSVQVLERSGDCELFLAALICAPREHAEH